MYKQTEIKITWKNINAFSDLYKKVSRVVSQEFPFSFITVH